MSSGLTRMRRRSRLYASVPQGGIGKIRTFRDQIVGSPNICLFHASPSFAERPVQSGSKRPDFRLRPSHLMQM
jgi:hypothetical protein